ncbi:MAG: hypothetical protein FWE20_02450 [Defluviitaleaceae bacterium]|nr:hypothetical protein [Defluviitaleaceae bacterium]
MYDKEFWKRTCIRQIFEFIRTGGEMISNDAKESTAEDRHKYYTTSFLRGMHLARDRIIAFDWNSVGNEFEKSRKTDEMFDELLNASSELSDLAFEVGFISGAKICDEVYQRTHSKTE